MYDILIRNGQVFDGTGQPGYLGDVGIVGGAIREIGLIPPEAQAKRTIDAAGLAVAPGFIDIHTHADIALLARPEHLPKIMQGVTTEVFTNCGLGFAPITGEGLEIQRSYIAGLFGDDGSDPKEAGNGNSAAARQKPVDWNWRTVGDFLGRYREQGSAVNIAYLIPHGSVRVSAMGMAERPADSAELKIMQSMVAQGMEEGAWGLSTGIWYAPMRSADHEELVTLCKTAGFFATHQRNYAENIFEATEESLSIARDAGVPIQIAHLQMNGEANAGRAPQLLERIEQARSSGVDVTCDTYPYTAGSTFIQGLLPSWAVDGGPEEILRRLSDADARSRIIADLSERPDERRQGWSRYTLAGAQSAANRTLEGLDFEAAAQARGMTVPEWMCAVLEEEELRACYIHHAAHEGNVRDILQWPGQMIGSDGLHLPGKTHPRLYGTFPRVLGKYVREVKVISLEQAIHKMTGMPAARLSLSKRGTLAEGHAADITIFDPATVCDVATFDDPLRYPTGVPYVFVNGVAVKDADQPTYALPGQVLRRV